MTYYQKGKMDEQIVIFGGTFDPIHHGHLISARTAAERLGFRKITFMPTYQPPHKGADYHPSASPEDRLEMVKLAIANEKIFEVSDIELTLARRNYTYDTLLLLREKFGSEKQISWLIGTDMLEELPDWYNAQGVVELARLITLARPPFNEKIHAILEKLQKSFTAEQVNRLRETIIPTPLIDISSTQIRDRIKNGKSIRYLTPDAVVDYILSKGLYR